MIENKYIQLTDNELVLLANSGDDRAMETLIDKYRGFVRTKTRAYFLIGADRDDIIQEGMIGLFKAIRDFETEKQASFKSFAELCITRQMITAIKAATRRKHSPLNTYVSLNKPAYDDDNERALIELLRSNETLDPEEILIDQENYGDTEKKIKSSLSKFEYQVLELYINGKTYHEIAKDMNKSSKSIDNALQRVKRKIQKKLSE